MTYARSTSQISGVYCVSVAAMVALIKFQFAAIEWLLYWPPLQLVRIKGDVTSWMNPYTHQPSISYSNLHTCVRKDLFEEAFYDGNIYTHKICMIKLCCCNKSATPEKCCNSLASLMWLQNHFERNRVSISLLIYVLRDPSSSRCGRNEFLAQINFPRYLSLPSFRRCQTT